MLKKTVLSALLLGAAVFAATPSEARPWAHPGFHPHARFVFRHDFRHFTPVEHRWWTGGRWHHMNWHGRYGWWWGVGGAFYFYPAPVYPYPADVSTTYYDDDSYNDQDNGGSYDDNAGPGDQGGGGYGTWYHCSNPEGYYPYVKSCRNGWEQVPAQPNDVQGGPQGGPQGGQDDGPPPNGQYDDQGAPPPPPHN